ncbi:hypothetical protein Pcinc_005809 [Petrolisthes cinctipes]|uniref:Uncharacterized protein n=1 Tax=Petrolisthes cinctipes TaxID=88211 RepID=A0AAE1GC09_PETCI|nr:hypothetical protein Pcinc_005809 [Petrolisthes cinctipes]
MARQYHVQCIGKKKIIKAEEKQQVPSAIIKEFVLNQENGEVISDLVKSATLNRLYPVCGSSSP